MKDIRQAEIHIQCQKGKVLDFTQREGVRQGNTTAFHFTWEEDRAVLETSVQPECWTGRLRLELRNRPAVENQHLAAENPVSLKLFVEEKPEKLTAMYLFGDWWTRPAFAEGFAGIPERTQVLYLKYRDRYGCLVPMVGESFKTTLAPGGGDFLLLQLTAYQGGQSRVDEPVFVYTEAPELSRAVEKAFAYLAQEKGIPLREGRRFPQPFRYLGWCSWDAFYTEICEEKVRAKARELYEKGLPVRWVLMDDGWLSVEDQGLNDYIPDKEKFPNAFSGMIADIKREGCISWFGVWHALAGYWGGVRPGSRLAEREKEHLFPAVNGKLLPCPGARGSGFFADWYRYLKREGIDFVKVDVQSAMKNQLENSIPVCRAARGMHQALEGGAAVLDGAIINCMGMAMENVLARPSSGVARNSDDFFPARAGSFTEHLLENAYNAIYHGQLYHCDWDMFWTGHEDGVKHSLLRAVSGGPVYFSDKIGETKPELLWPLVCRDGEILMMDRPACPTADCIFTDPVKQGVLKLENTAGNGGGIAAYNLTEGQQRCTVSPDEIRGLPAAERYLIYNYFAQEAQTVPADGTVSGQLEPGGCAWYQVVPFAGGAAILGLAEKYVGFAAWEPLFCTEQAIGGTLKEQGPVRFASLRAPKQIFCNGTDVSDRLRQEATAGEAALYTVHLAPEGKKAVLEIRW